MAARTDERPPAAGRRPPGGERSASLTVGLGLAAVMGALGLVAGVVYSGAAAASLIKDPGAAVRWGLPAAEMVYNFSLAITVGMLILASIVIPRTSGGSRRHPSAASRDSSPSGRNPAWDRALDVASITAIVWTLSAMAVLILGYIDTVGAEALQSGNFSAQLGVYVTQLETGRSWLIITVIAAVVSTLIFGVRSQTGVGLLALAGLVAVLPQALTGHAGDAKNHEIAVSSIGLHVVGVVIWFGGILGLAILGNRLGPKLSDIVARFSRLALCAFVLVVFSGVVNASLRVGWDDIFSPYGTLIVVKALASIALGVIGWWHRQFVVDKLGLAEKDGAAPARRLFWQLIAAELALLGLASGVAVALSRSAPPVSQEVEGTLSPAEILSGYPLPPELTPMRWFSEWRPDVLWIVVAGFAIVAYWRGVYVLRRRGDTWPWHRPILWTIGMLGLVYITSGGPAVYGKIMFSAHMVQHMTLAMAIPLPMVLGAPVTLLMRAVPARTDDSRGPREWVLAAVHSLPARFVSHPLIAAVVFAGSIVIFYYSPPLIGLSMSTHIGHELMVLHFLIAGYLFAQALVGIDPGPTRFAYPLRLVLLLATMAFHAFFGVTLMSSNTLLDASWFGNMGRPWGASAIEDQQTGGGIAWGIGEFPTFILALVVAGQWSRSSEREAVRYDRKAARTGEAELNAYNDMLAKMSGADKPGGGKTFAGEVASAEKGSAGEAPASAAPTGEAPTSGKNAAGTTPTGD